MPRLEKLRERIARNPRHVTFRDLDRLLRGYGFTVRQPSKGSSHYVYEKGRYTLVIPYRRPYLLPIYVRRALAILDRIQRQGEENNG